ncbi:response regulator [Paenibacillus sp. GSMTC-2017]|uniref:response regulator n=1 Tax=Paenibacillus sp. GSMTC-2017 TaxID=2794350 RepID=UPI0018D681EE|nr:response regulator [Paenibacillus sp. GSMTC-2017]MBH5319665.1 response regulator [Paenibacillus sp. GSMTC-2017]
MKTILVDNEPLALQHLAEELNEIGGWEIIGKFRNAKLALEHIYESRPEAIFLDIDMPEMNGIELAECVLEKLPMTHVVFVTAYEEYAVKAFDINAQDYILKPIQRDRLKKMTTRIQQQLPVRSADTKEAIGNTIVHCFRSLQFQRFGQEPLTLRWKTIKAQELFLFLMHNRGKSVHKEAILEQLWPDIEWKKGTIQLYTAIYQIRRLLQDERIDIQVDSCEGGYRLDVGNIILDIELWESRLKDAPKLASDTVDVHVQLCSQYSGDYLAEYSYNWAETEKQRLRSKWLQHVHLVASYYIEQGAYADAAEHYLGVQSILPEEESLYFELMKINEKLEDRFSVEKQYELLIHMLHQHFDATPRGNVKAWYETWSNRELHNNQLK